ncbi:DUF6314 family protein [Pseudoroseicyclus sp. CXY001]|uniref:DUF6314 family protein n=1 Tax=Pseudoroseicyclus sp. CXY001 TaxID=3242492 RepID=UPI003571661A
MELTAEAFRGRWALERAIDDRRAGEAGRFTGEAVLTGEGEALRYREEGLLTLGGRAPLKAARVYLWELSGGRLRMFFEDGRAFHEVTGEAPAALHPCGEDLYRVRYNFAQWPEWRAVWEVSGPRKDYRMDTRYRRL